MRKTKQKVWMFFLLLFLIGMMTACSEEDSWEMTAGGVDRVYKMDWGVIESAIEVPWQYLSDIEQYGYITSNEREFVAKGTYVDEALIESTIGMAVAKGYDYANDTEHTMDVEIYKVSGISEEYMFAAKLGERYYMYGQSEYLPPNNFGELLDAFNLKEHLSFLRYAKNVYGAERYHFQVEDDGPIWDMLYDCRDAEFVEGKFWNTNEENYISFTATSDALGCYKRAFQVSESGYIWTNIWDYEYIFQIGEEAASEIISYVGKDRKSVYMEPYYYYVVGKISEITDEYVVIDDSKLCAKQKDGIEFKLYLDDSKIAGLIACYHLGKGDIVVVTCKEKVDVEAGYVIKGPVDIQEAFLQYGIIEIPE